MEAERVTMKRVTIRQVAREAGVSTQTVSRVLNERPDVAAETRKLVREVIARLDYEPSAIARSLVSRRTYTLGLITSDFTDYFFTQVFVGATEEARQHGYYFMLSSTEHNSEDEPECIRLLTQHHVAGILLARPGLQSDDDRVLRLLRGGVAVVAAVYHPPGAQLLTVDVDNVDGGSQATSCLLNNGHHRVAMIAGPARWRSVCDRATGYRAALEAAGIPYDPTLIVEGDWSYASGYRAMRQLLAGGCVFSALFAQNDRMAIGAIRALREAGRRVPDDVAVVGYDDIPVAEYCDPPLTTVHQPMQEVGRMATRLLIRAIESPGGLGEEVRLKAYLVRRDSCGTPVAS